jgi:hypothetical protein
LLKGRRDVCDASRVIDINIKEEEVAADPSTSAATAAGAPAQAHTVYKIKNRTRGKLTGHGEVSVACRYETRQKFN